MGSENRANSDGGGDTDGVGGAVTYYFYGEDAYRARQAIEELAREHKARLRWLDEADFEDKSPGEILGRGSRSLFGSELLVMVDVSNLPVALQSDILAALKRGSPLCVLWDRGKPDKRSAVYGELKGKGREFKLPLPRAAAEWVQAEAGRRGGSIDGAAARELVERIGVDSWRLVMELEKLLVAGEPVTVGVVKERVPEAPTAEIFATLEALVGGDKKRAVESIEILLGEGDSEFYILSMLAYQFRTLLAVRRGIDKGQSQTAIAQTSGLKPYSVQKSYSPAQRAAANYWRDALTRVLATDFSIKRGRIDARTGLMMLVLNLTKER